MPSGTELHVLILQMNKENVYDKRMHFNTRWHTIRGGEVLLIWKEIERKLLRVSFNTTIKNARALVTVVINAIIEKYITTSVIKSNSVFERQQDVVSGGNTARIAL
jgi:hypothetical protein